MTKKEKIKRILRDAQEQAQNRTGGGAFGKAESPRIAKTLDEWADEIDKLYQDDCQTTGIGSVTEYWDSTT